MAEDLMERISALRSKPFALRPQAKDIPCNETSDAERLCRNPLVSVCLCTYNQENTIRQAIDGVLNQKTDFEYELIIGDDASTDRTREICFEYQRHHPEKVRVLWSEENQYAVGGNGIRTFGACRGKYIAYCEGDDYWTNLDKLQLQVDIFRRYPDLGICLMGTDCLYEATGSVHAFDPQRNLYGLVKPGRRVAAFVLFKGWIRGYRLKRKFYQTSGWMFSAQALATVTKCYGDAFSRTWAFRDILWLVALVQRYESFFLNRTGSVYRIHGGGVSFTRSLALRQDSLLLKIYWLVRAWGLPYWLVRLLYARSIWKLCGKAWR